MSRNKDRGLPGNGGELASNPGREAEGERLTDALGVEMAIARKYGQKTLTALSEIVRLSDVGTRLANRGHDWYSNDPENVPGLAAEGLIIKIGENVARVSRDFEGDHPEIPWQVIKDMRNRLTHYYEATDYEVVWSTLDADFPQINSMIVGLLGRTNKP